MADNPELSALRSLIRGICWNGTVFDQESGTYRPCNVGKLLILRSRNSISDRLLGSCGFLFKKASIYHAIDYFGRGSFGYLLKIHPLTS